MHKEIVVPNKQDIEYYTKYGFNSFILPLEGYSLGCDIYFSLQEINKFAKKYKVFVLMNRLLHRDIEKFKDIYNNFDSSIMFIVEDIGLTSIISKERIILYENHIISNYKAINYLYDLGYKNVVINNDLTIEEIKEIIKETKSGLYYFYINRNQLMYSRRALVSNFNEYYNINNDKLSYDLEELSTHKKLIIREEEKGSICFYNKIFCSSKYYNELNNLNLIINFNTISDEDEKIILENYKRQDLIDMINGDNYFLEHEIKYKVGDL